MSIKLFGYMISLEIIPSFQIFTDGDIDKHVSYLYSLYKHHLNL